MKKVNIKLVISQLHLAFSYLNRDLFQGKLPEPAILIQSRGNRKLTLGWCTVGKVWKNEVTQEERYEINLVAEAINRGLLPVMATLLHEMVHLYNLENGIKDTSRGYTYHNKNFKEVAESHGLIIEHADKIGWSVTSLQQSTINLIYSYGLDEEAFTMGRIEASGEDKKEIKRIKNRKYECPSCGAEVKSTMEVNIICGDCNIPFVLTNPDDFEIDKEVEKVEYVCLDCGEVIELERDSNENCPSCGGEIALLEEVSKLQEEEIELNDGAGNMIPVVQYKIA